MTKEQKENRYTSTMSIESFINGFKMSFVTKTFNSAKECRQYAWTKEAKEEKTKPIVRLFTEGFCYYFAIILKEAYPGGTVCLLKGHGHIVYLYRGKFYDITGELTNRRNRYIPVEYFGEFINDFKQNYVSGGATKTEIEKCVKQAERDDNILSMSHNVVHCITKDVKDII